MPDGMPNFSKWLGAALALVAAVAISGQPFFNFQKQADGHRASRYLAVAKERDRLDEYFADGSTDANTLREQLERLARINDRINRDAESFPTSNKDYRLA
ncbi:hypothetical protein [Alicyclobacillus mengziensis]|uniref:Uncharacterized protein n=1 Tax=Alicyclobacillus mengziensis TaxID=2931921 RepID=A0A9X7W1R2_9BACL|nr:hypothetical protein [Alicyclobacillus mengziensis]QSO48597.1 hypothetical protein JZ786_06365 [Alicyclobacillus mengziensis]